MRHEIQGKKFFRWTVISFSHSKRPHNYWTCRCECGTERVVQENSLVTGITKSCGCLRSEKAGRHFIKHASCGQPGYKSWAAMRARCNKVNSFAYKDYGGRGIKVCERWNDFTKFWEDMGPTWSLGLTLERKDFNGNYEPSNCTWIPRSEQSKNRRGLIFVETDQGRMTVGAAAKIAGVSRGCMEHRIAAKWPMSEILSRPSYRRRLK